MTKEQIQQKIQYGDLQGAISTMSAMVPDGAREKNDLILLESRLARTNREINGGLILSRDAQVSFNKIANAALSLLDMIDIHIQVKVKDSGPRTVLFLGANPKDLDVLRITDENQKIKDVLRNSTKAPDFNFESEMAIQIQTITRAVQLYKPSIIHFSGHGSGHEGISIEGSTGEEVLYPNTGLDRLFKMTKKHVQCVLLNACYSESQAEIISQHDNYVIGMNNAILDEASIQFSLGFYQSLGEGASYEDAYEFAMVNIAHFLDDAVIPQLWKNGKIIST